MAKIDHVFVLIMENRSFDHMFAFSGLPGIQPPLNPNFKPGAPDRLTKDPPHEYEHVKAQINNGKMDGFTGDAMFGLLPGRIPRLMELAQNFLLMDNWFSSMPGPTWPNRMFAHAASSCGLDNSLRFNELGDAVYNPQRYLSLPRGHIFERCIAQGVSWRVYKTDRFVQALGMRGMVDAATAPGNRDKFFRDTSKITGDLKNSDAAQYTFIEPYHAPPNFANGTSQHPVGSIAAGDEFIYQVYSAIRKSPLWSSSLLLVTWDEHGGFYDHVPPPTAPPPGESVSEQAENHAREAAPGDCMFDRLGPRVPALLISPFVPKGLGSQVFAGKTFEHSSIVASLRENFNLGKPLTARDAWAPTWTPGLSANARKDIPPPTAVQKITVAAPDKLDVRVLKAPPDGSLAGFALVAADMDWHIAKHIGVPPLAVSHFRQTLPTAAATLSDPTVNDPSKKVAHKVVLNYLAAVHKRIGEYEKLQRSVDLTKMSGTKKSATSKSAKKGKTKGVAGRVRARKKSRDSK